MLKLILDAIGAKTLFIYGCGVRGRMFAMSAAEAGVKLGGLIVSDGHKTAETFVVPGDQTLKIYEFSEFRSTISDASDICVVNTVNNGAMYGIISAVDDIMTARGGTPCIDLTDGKHDDCQYDCLRTFLRTLDVDIESDILKFKGMSMYNPVRMNKDSLRCMFPAIGDIVMPGIYNDTSLINIGSYESRGGVQCVINDTVIDIGASVGFFSCYAAHKGCQVYAFEPSQGILPILQRQSDLYPGRITVVPKGVADKTGVISFNAMANDMTGSINSNFGKSGEYTIDVVALDDFVRENSLPSVDFIKCCAPSAELIIEGARETIRRFAPKISLHIITGLHEDLEAVIDMIRSANSAYVFERGASKLYAHVPSR